VPITRRARLTYDQSANLRFRPSQIVMLVSLFVLGVVSSVLYLNMRYESTSRSADYTDSQRLEANHAAAELVLEKTDDWDNETVVCIVDSAFRPLFEKETDYTVSVYIVDVEAFARGQQTDASYSMDTLWGYSKSGPKKDPYGSLIKVATVTFTKNENTGEILAFDLKIATKTAG